MSQASWNELRLFLVEVRNADYRSDPERAIAVLDALESIVQEILEKLHKANV